MRAAVGDMGGTRGPIGLQLSRPNQHVVGLRGLSTVPVHICQRP